MSRTDLDPATLAASLRRMEGDGSVEWVTEPMQTRVLLDVADMLDENAKLRERIARLEQAVEKMVNYDAEDHHLEIWPDCDVPETILITGRDGELEFSPTVLLDKQTSRSRNLMYLFRKTFDALRAVENEYGLDVMVAHTPVIAAEAKKLGIEVSNG